jgi:hypothetical protein
MCTTIEESRNVSRWPGSPKSKPGDCVIVLVRCADTAGRQQQVIYILTLQVGTQCRVLDKVSQGQTAFDI